MLVLCCCLRNHLRTKWLKTTVMFVISHGFCELGTQKAASLGTSGSGPDLRPQSDEGSGSEPSEGSSCPGLVPGLGEPSLGFLLSRSPAVGWLHGLLGTARLYSHGASGLQRHVSAKNTGGSYITFSAPASKVTQQHSHCLCCGQNPSPPDSRGRNLETPLNRSVSVSCLRTYETRYISWPSLGNTTCHNHRVRKS